jgi:hypothetical protein
MLSVRRRYSPFPALLGILAALGAGQGAWAAGCEVIEFAAAKHLSEGAGVKTLVGGVAAAPGNTVVLEAAFGCVGSLGFDPVGANNEVTVEVLETSSGTFADPGLAGSWTSFAVPSGDVASTDCQGSACNGLIFAMPDSGFAGPARITVEVGGVTRAHVFALGAKSAACEAESEEPLAGSFTLLPSYNALVASKTGALNDGLEGAIAWNGSLWVPLEHDLGSAEPGVDAVATRATGVEISQLGGLTALGERFIPLPTIHKLVPFGGGQALFSTTDVPRSTVRVVQSDFPTNFHTLRSGDAGPVVFPNTVTVAAVGASPVIALRSSPSTVALGLAEELLGDLNLDGDSSDLLYSATDVPTGTTTNTGQAIALVAASDPVPVSSVSGDVAAFLHDEARDGNMDLNGDGIVDDQVVRVLKGGVPLNPGVPTDTTADPLRSVDGQQLGISGDYVFFRTPENATAPQFSARVSEDGVGTGGDGGSQTPAIDDLAEHVIYASAAANLAAGTSGAKSQILVADLLTPGVHELVSANGGEGNGDSFEPSISADGYHASFTSLSTSFGAGGGASTPVVWERGTNVVGTSVGGLAFALFDLATGEEDVPGVDYSPCTAVVPGLAISLNTNMTVSGSLIAPDGPACTFLADFDGTWDVAPAGPIQVGSVITVNAVITSSTLLPELVGVADLGFAATNIVSAVNGPNSFDFEGTFDLTGTTGVANTVAQVYARALGGGAPLQLVSEAVGGGGGTGASGESVIGASGEEVAFASVAADLIALDTNNASDVFVRSLTSDTTVRVSVANSTNSQANGASSEPAMTPGGNEVSFTSTASNLIGAGNDNNGFADVFLRDRGASTTELISVALPGGSRTGASGSSDLSHDARMVIFETTAPLDPADTNGVMDVYLRDRSEGRTQRVSVRAGGEEEAGASWDPKISGDGTVATFTSQGSFVPGVPAGTNVFRKNLITGTVEWLSVGAGASDVSAAADPDADGRTVAFDSDAPLVLDTSTVDVFVRSTGMGTDLNDDEDDFDAVFQSFFASTATPGLQPAARVASSNARTGFGRAVVSVPESDQGNSNLNASSLVIGAGGDADSDDGVLHLWDGATAQLVNLGIAGTEGAVSPTTLCALVDEAQQGADLGGAVGTTDQVLVAGDIATLLGSPSVGDLVNTGRAATQVHVADTVCIYTEPAGTLRFFDLATGFDVSSGLPATAIMVGPSQELIAFRVPENPDWNGDGDSLDEVMHITSKTAIQSTADGGTVAEVTNTQLAGQDCTAPGCLAFPFGSILSNGAISFLGTEQDQSLEQVLKHCLVTNSTVCDFTGDGDGLDTVVHYVTTRQTGGTVAAIASGALALSSTGEQQTNPFPQEGPQGTSISIELTECEAAKIACPSVRGNTADQIPVADECTAQFDVDNDDVLDCLTLRSYVGLDLDNDIVLDVFDNCPALFNPDQDDDDGDGLGNDCDDNDDSPAPCELDCDLNEDDDIDQDDLNMILAAVAAGAPAQGGTTTPQCGDRRDRNDDRALTFLDVSLCKADFCTGCSAPAGAGPSGGGAPSAGCGIGPELVLLIPLLGALRRRRRRGA